MKSRINHLFEERKNVHVVYFYKGMKAYIEQAMSYIKEGVIAGNYVIFVENERIYSINHKELSTWLTKEQLELIHYVNNFDFYYSIGSYNPATIIDYFNKMIQPYVERKISIRSWAHVEWATMDDPFHLIKDVEKLANKAENLLSLPLICAYEGKRLSHYLQTLLLEAHPYVLIENGITKSEQYHSIKKEQV